MVRSVTIGLAAALAAAALAGAQAVPPHHLLTLEVTPEESRNPTGTSQELRATISAPSPVPQLEVHFKVATGPNARIPNGATAVDFADPDGTCVIPATQTTCTWTLQDRNSPRGGVTDTVFAWIDHDERFGRDQLSLAGLHRDEIPDAGAPPHEPGLSGHANAKGEPDATDVVLAHWGQLGARALPFLDGLDRAATACATGTARSGGLVTGTARRCTFLLRLPARNEEDPGRDYYALWVQADAQARRGWCARGLQVSLRAPAGTRLLSVAAPRRGRSAATGVLRTRLVAGGGGFAFVRGLAEQATLSRRGTVSLARRPGRATLAWAGTTRNAVALAAGAELSVAAGSRAPRLAGAGEARLRVSRC